MLQALFAFALAALTAVAGPARGDASYDPPPAVGTVSNSSTPGNTGLDNPPADASGAGALSPAVPKTPAASDAAEAKPPLSVPAASPEEATARYSFHRVGDVFIRLDSQTGQVAQCGWAAEGWSCKTVADERAALDNEIARLQHENAQLKKSLLSRGLELPNSAVAEAPSQPAPVPPANVPDPTPNANPKGPSDPDFNRAVAFVKHVWRRLVDLMIDLQRDIQRRG